MKRFFALAASFGAALTLVAACAEDESLHDQTGAFEPLPTIERPPARVGQSIDLIRIGDQRIAVQLDRIINPATVPHGWAEPGKNYLATQFTITNNAATTVTANSNSEISLVGTDGNDYQAEFRTVTECKDFVYGWFLIPPADSVTGCVVFALPHGVAAKTVRYSPSSGMSRDIGEWSLS